jgi:small subunit ribosomal protein S1
VKVILAEIAGFCSGVRKAVDALLEEAENRGGGSTLGPLVHNEEVIEYLKQRSIATVDQPEDATGSFIAVRTHGVTPQLLDRLQTGKNFDIINLTCSRVGRVQKIAAELQEKGYTIYIFGDKNHPEVIGLIGWAGENAVPFSSLEELEDFEIVEPAALIAQTTANPDSYKQAGDILLNKSPNALIYHTLCPETKLRQEEVTELAKRVEALVVVGSETSANTNTLYNCCRQLLPTCRVNNAWELDRSFLERYTVIGVTAGASTPPWTIKEVVERMENENSENMEAASEVQSEEQFEFNEDVKVAQVGEQVTGKVARATEEEVFIDIGAKTEAILPLAEVHLPEGKTLAEVFNPEDSIEVTVLEIDEQDGKVVVSHKRLAREKRLTELEEALKNDQIIKAPVKQVVGAGMVIDLGNGIEGFMPGSLVDVRFIPDFNEFKDQVISFKILEFDRDKGKLILTRKKIMEEEVEQAKGETLKAIEVGSTITGTVKRLTDFGAFVDVGGIDGLVHISEMSWDRVNHPSEVLKVGDQIEVKVLEVIPEKERISLSIRKTLPDPWTKAAEDLESGQIMTGKVTRLVNFGAFIELKPGVEGLAHISQLADFHVKHPSEVLTEGEEVEVKVIEVKAKSKRISLSIKEAGGVAMVSGSTSSSSDGENGNVTLGDVFGSLFDNEDYSPNVKPEAEEAEQAEAFKEEEPDEKAEGVQE